jgi:hypothetical protein
LQAEHAGAIDARRQRQRRLRARGFVDRALQFGGLIVGAAGTHAILRDVAAERGDEGRRARWLRRNGKRAGDTGGGCSNEMTAVHGHAE